MKEFKEGYPNYIYSLVGGFFHIRVTGWFRKTEGHESRPVRSEKRVILFIVTHCGSCFI